MVVDISDELAKVLCQLSDDINITIEQIVDTALWDYLIKTSLYIVKQDKELK